MSTHDFKSQHLVLNKCSSYKVKKLNLRHYRISVFPLVPNPNKGLYLVPKKECLKYVRKVVFGFDSESSRKEARKVLRHVKYSRPTGLTISATSIYKLTEKLDLLTYINNSSNLTHLCFRIEGGLIEQEITNILYILLLRSPNLKFLSLDLRRCSIRGDSLIHFLNGLVVQSKLSELIFNVSYADIGDQEIAHLAETLSQPVCKLQCLKSIIMSLKANRRVTNEGIIPLADYLNTLNELRTFKFDIVGTSVTAVGLKSLFDSLMSNKELDTFYIHASEIFNIYSVLTNFLEAQQNLSQVGLDLSHDSQIDLETLKIIQNAVAKLPRLVKYKLNVDGCHSLKEHGTFYVPESLKIFQSLKELEVHFASFIESEDRGLVALEALIESMSSLSQLESLVLDFSSCADWFTETDNEMQAKFLETFSLLKNLRSLALHFKKSQINPHNLQKLQSSLCDLKHLSSLELDLSFCKSVKEKDLKGILLHFASSLNLISLKVLADDINYDENKLGQDIHHIAKSSKTMQELYISLKKTLMGRQAATIVSKFEPKHPGFDLVVVGGKAFTVMPGTNQRYGFRPPVKSRFGK